MPPLLIGEYTLSDFILVSLIQRKYLRMIDIDLVAVGIILHPYAIVRLSPRHFQSLIVLDFLAHCYFLGAVCCL